MIKAITKFIDRIDAIPITFFESIVIILLLLILQRVW